MAAAHDPTSTRPSGRSRDRPTRAGRAHPSATVEDERSSLVDTTVKEFGRLSILVKNAGGTEPRASMRHRQYYLSTASHFNAVAPFLLSRLAAQAMVDTDGSGSIVYVSSRSGDLVMSSTLAYGAGKAALNTPTQNMAADLGPRVRLNAIGVGGWPPSRWTSSRPMTSCGPIRGQHPHAPYQTAQRYCICSTVSGLTSVLVGHRVVLRVDGATRKPSSTCRPAASAQRPNRRPNQFTT